MIIGENGKDKSWLDISDAGTFRIVINYYDDNSGDGWLTISPPQYLGESPKAPLYSVNFIADDPEPESIADFWISEREAALED
jgi:hypothetical protein